MRKLDGSKDVGAIVMTGNEKAFAGVCVPDRCVVTVADNPM